MLPSPAGRWTVRASESVFFHPKLEGVLPALCDQSNFFLYYCIIDCTDRLDLTICLIPSFYIITADNQLGVSVNNKVCIMAGKHELTVALRLPDLLHNISYHLAVYVVFRLV